MATAIKDPVFATNSVLQHLREHGNGNVNSGPNGSRNPAKGNPVINPNFQGLFESFEGDYDPMVVEEWLMGVEKIFRVLGCTDAQKVTYATYMLTGEAKHWWKGAKRLLESQGTEITWEVFQNNFLDKYIPENAKYEKEFEFLELKQGNMSVDHYVAKFEELSKFSLYLKQNPDERWKARRVEPGLRLEIRHVVSVFMNNNFLELVDKCRMIEKNLPDMEYEKQKQSFWKRKREENRQKKNVKPKFNQENGSQIQRYTRLIIYSRCGQTQRNQTCYYGKNVCYNYGKPRHLFRDCLSRKVNKF